jgi:hypothetical protein
MPAERPEIAAVTLTGVRADARLVRPSQATPHLATRPRGQPMQARMRQMYLVTVVAVGLGVVLGGTAFAQSNNPFTGNWKLNLAQSQFGSGLSPTSGTFVIQKAQEADSVKFATTAIVQMTWPYSAHFDSSEQQVPQVDSIAVKRAGANTSAFTIRERGRVVRTGKIVVSKDGKLLTVTAAGTNAEGQKVHSLQVYDKQ